MNSAYIGEALGMFVFVYIALTQSDPITIAVGLFIGIVIAVTFKSKAFLNPAIALASYGKGDNISGDECAFYIGGELVGAAAALGIFMLFKNQITQ